ncbi:MAG: nucleoside triphosphate pyrophosphohydrolase [Bacteroidales bacterium]|jgi:MazG family protein|nr:nucleoside triphosphate pyrophosphohydrolase [Bacteroidales bacterium]
MESSLQEFKRLLDIMDELREKCPWDSKQTLESLRTLTIEETYELADAIINNDLDSIREELGDILLHIVFYAKIGSEKSAFDITDVLKGISEKLIFRHPHIFGDVKVRDSQEVEENWEQIKLKENTKKRVLSGVPNTMPALVKAYRMQDKARAVGFDWDEKEQVWDKVLEELDEVKEAIREKSQAEVEAEFGDLFFSLINAARLYDVNPENALERTNIKFRYRFNYLENKARDINRKLRDMSLEEMDAIWNEAKLNADNE